jgi:hypothetical protein
MFSFEVGIDQGRWIEKSGCGFRVPPRCQGRRKAASSAHVLVPPPAPPPPHECGVGFAAFKGHESPLRHQTTVASCRSGGHTIWWNVEAAGEGEALRLLPTYVAERTTVSRISEVEIP